MLRALALSTLLCSCAATETGTLDVALETRFTPGTDFLRVRVELYDGPPAEGGNLSARPQETEAIAGESYVDARRVARFGPLLAGRFIARVSLSTPSGRLLASRTARAEVTGDTEVVVTIDEEDLVGGGLPCANGVDAATVALYTFDADGGGTSITDATGSHHGTFVGAMADVIPGPEGCGDALVFSEASDVYAEIPHSADFDLDSGSLELWVRPHTVPDDAIHGVIGRDALNTTRPGHISLWFVPDRRLVARLQNPDGEAHRCSNEPIEIDQWTHVGINFGPEGFELWVDGAVMTFTGEIVVDPDPTMGSTITCGGGTVAGIAGNENPWVFGASSGGSDEGAATPAGSFFRGGAIDHVRIAEDRRAFGR